MDYKGGTYLSQVVSIFLQMACADWAENLEIPGIIDFGESSKTQIIEQMQVEIPISIKNLTNAWCVSVLLPKGLALITIIQTENLSDNRQSATDN